MPEDKLRGKTQEKVLLALFKEDQVDVVAEAVLSLRQLGVIDRDMSVISGVPFSDKILGRPMNWTRVPQMALAGAALGILVSLFLNLGTPLLYPIRVGGQPYLPIPTTIVLTFELGMLGLMLATFLGVFIETVTPGPEPKGYHPEITDGKIGLLFRCASSAELEKKAEAALLGLGAEMVADPHENDRTAGGKKL